MKKQTQNSYKNVYKVQCIGLYAKTGRVVAMCGDGGNDSGALKVAMRD